MRYDVAVVGGGASGMLAAYAAAKQGCSVILLEKNEKLGKKLYITGKGRCNLTNAADMDVMQSKVVSNPRFLYSAFSDFTNRDICDLIKGAGCPLKEERGQRIFPVSDKSSDVIAALKKILSGAGVTVCLDTEVESLTADYMEGQGKEKSRPKITGLKLKKKGIINAGAVVLATGGLSYPATGSTGDGYRMAEELGHSVTKLLPALVGLRVREAFVAGMQGLSLKNITASVWDGNKRLFSEFGEMLFTADGVSGPVILSASSFIAGTLLKKNLLLTIDLKPALTEEKLTARLMRDFEENRNKQFCNSLDALFPKRLAENIVRMSKIPPDKKVNSITNKERAAIISLTKAFPLTLTGTGSFQEAVITQGGVNIREVNPSSMGSKKADGLFFAGELLDLDAVTGGFNLQIAWSTGHLAGISAARYSKTP